MAQHNIPHNYSEGRLVAGAMIKTKNLIEAFCLGIIPFVSIMQFKVISNLVTRITVATVVAMAPASLGLFGMNGDSLSVFVAKWLRYRKSKRIAIYNPRVKTEISPISNNDIQVDQLLPRDKITLFIKGFDDRRKAKKFLKKAIANETITEDAVFFYDDVGIIEIPDEYKTDREIKKETQLKKRKVKFKNKEK